MFRVTCLGVGAGVFFDYNGGLHLDPARRRADRNREELLRDIGLELVEVVAKDLAEPTTLEARMTRARAVGLAKAGPSTLTLSGASTGGGDVTVAGGTLLVAAGASLGTGTNITVAGGTLKLMTSSGLSDAATLRIADGGANVYLPSGTETVGALYLGGRRQRRGTYGAANSGAATIDAAHFTGTGTLRVLHGPETVILIR